MTKLRTTTPIPVQLSGPEFIAFIFPHLSMPMRGPKCKLGYHRVFNLILWVLYTGVAVGDRVTPAPPRRSRRAAFPHRAPVEGRTRSKFGAWAAHTPSIRRLAASVTRQCPALCPGHALPLAFPSTGRLPSTISATDLRSALFEASQVLCSRPNSSPLPRRLRLLDFPSRPVIA